ncbi:MAG TPA: hypothetical protein VJW77_02315 [Terriglobia bacterium]|nr:hypothetical protein [Terriglobia bacterium]
MNLGWEDVFYEVRRRNLAIGGSVYSVESMIDFREFVEALEHPEKRLLLLLLQGYNRSEIAAELKIQRPTLRVYVCKLNRKIRAMRSNGHSPIPVGR